MSRHQKNSQRYDPSVVEAGVRNIISSVRMFVPLDAYFFEVSFPRGIEENNRTSHRSSSRQLLQTQQRIEVAAHSQLEHRYPDIHGVRTIVPHSTTNHKLGSTDTGSMTSKHKLWIK